MILIEIVRKIALCRYEQFTILFTLAFIFVIRVVDART